MSQVYTKDRDICTVPWCQPRSESALNPDLAPISHPIVLSLMPTVEGSMYRGAHYQATESDSTWNKNGHEKYRNTPHLSSC